MDLSELYQARTFIGLGTSSEPKTLSSPELWELYTDGSSPDWDYLQMNSHMEAGLQFLSKLGTLSGSDLHRAQNLLGARNFTKLGTFTIPGLPHELSQDC